MQRSGGAGALWGVGVHPELSSDGFDQFVAGAGRRLRQVLSAEYGIDVGAEAADAALAWAWEHWARLSGMSNPGGYLYRVAQSNARRSIARGRLVTLPPEPPPTEDAIRARRRPRRRGPSSARTAASRGRDGARLRMDTVRGQRDDRPACGDDQVASAARTTASQK